MVKVGIGPNTIIRDKRNRNADTTNIGNNRDWKRLPTINLDIFIGTELANYEIRWRGANLSDLAEVSLMGNGKSNEAERQELSGPDASSNGNNYVAANSCLKPVTVNTKQSALIFIDWLDYFDFILNIPFP